MEEVLSPQGPKQQAVLFPAVPIYLPAEIRALTPIKPTLSERSHADVEDRKALRGPEQQAVLFPAGSIYLPAEIRALTAIKPTLSERSHADVEALQMLIHNAEEAAKVSPMARTYMRSIVKRLEELQLRLKIWISDVDIGSGVLEHKGGQNGPSVDLCSVVRAAFSTLEVNLNDIGDNLSTMRGLFLHMKELGLVMHFDFLEANLLALDQIDFPRQKT